MIKILKHYKNINKFKLFYAALIAPMLTTMLSILSTSLIFTNIMRNAHISLIFISFILSFSIFFICFASILCCLNNKKLQINILSDKYSCNENDANINPEIQQINKNYFIIETNLVCSMLMLILSIPILVILKKQSVITNLLADNIMISISIAFAVLFVPTIIFAARYFYCNNKSIFMKPEIITETVKCELDSKGKCNKKTHTVKNINDETTANAVSQ